MINDAQKIRCNNISDFKNFCKTADFWGDYDKTIVPTNYPCIIIYFEDDMGGQNTMGWDTHFYIVYKSDFD